MYNIVKTLLLDQTRLQDPRGQMPEVHKHNSRIHITAPSPVNHIYNNEV